MKGFSEFVADALHPVLIEAGYRKERLTWRRDAGETILVVTIRKSRDGRSFALLLGAAVKARVSKDRPAIDDCHLSFLFYKAVPKPWVDKALSHATEIGDMETPNLECKMIAKRDLILPAFTGHALPFLESLDSIDACRNEAMRRKVVSFVRPDRCAELMANLPRSASRR